MIEDYTRSITWLKSKFIEGGKKMKSKDEDQDVKVDES